jgi:hypothetical protein
MRSFRFSPALPQTPAFTLGDGLIVLGLGVLIYTGARLAVRTPAVIAGPDISLSFRALPWYALLSTGRMTVAYFLSLFFTLTYGYAAARNLTAEKVMLPLLDVLQSVPILSFLPVVLLSLSAVLPQGFATELAAVVLIFTSQAWNMTYSFYQSMTTIPNELGEAAAIFRFDPWLRFKTMELPFAALGLIWNSMMSWAGSQALGTAPGQPGPTQPLPRARLNALAGLLEKVVEEAGRADLYRLSDEFIMELDDLLPIVEAGELLSFVTVQEGDLLLTPLGQTYADASILARKEVLAGRVLRVPMIAWIYETLQRDDNRRVAWDYFLDKLQSDFGDRAEEQLETAISWGRHAELFAYDDDAGELYLEPR